MSIDLFYIIFMTVFMLVICLTWLFVESYYLGGDYYIFGNYARKKTFFEKFFDGLKVMLKL